MKTKRRLNLKLFGALILATLVLGTGVHFLHGFQVRRKADYLFQKAEETKAEWEKAKAAAEAAEDRATRRTQTAEARRQLDQALDYLSRYLALKPLDDAARALHGELLDQSADGYYPTDQRKSVEQRLQAFFVLEQASRQDPANTDVRRRIVRVALHPTLPRIYRHYDEARTHIDELLKTS